MSADKVAEILDFAQGLDLHGRSEKFATVMRENDIETALSLCDAAILDSEEMTRPDRTIFRRSVHEKNQRKLRELRKMVEQLRKKQ